MTGRRSFGFDVPPALAATAVSRRLDPDETLFIEGDAARELIGIVSGHVRLWRTLHDGSACTLLALGPGELIGSVAVAQGTPQLTCATAMTPVELLCWSAATFRVQLRTSDQLPGAFLAIVARRAAQLLDRVEDIANLPVEKRLARAILRFAGENGTHDDSLAVIVNVRQQDLADMALTTVPTVSRILAAWGAEGVTHARRGKVIVPHLTRLALVAGLHLD